MTEEEDSLRMEQEENAINEEFGHVKDAKRIDTKQIKDQRVAHDLDVLYSQKQSNHMAVISDEKEYMSFKEKYAYRTFAPYSCGFLSTTNPFRWKLIQLVQNEWFDRFVLLIILANCCLLAYDQPDRRDDPDHDELMKDAELVFLIIFTIEMVIRIIAMGFIGKKSSYLRDAWNILDFIVVISGWAELIMSSLADSSQSTNLSALRTIRILRPLRTINNLRGMRILVTSLLKSLPMMFDILVLAIFLLTLYSIIGTQNYSGKFKRRCFFDETDELVHPDDAILCDDDDSCGDGQYCADFENPNYGVTNFDNIGWALLTTFTCITLEGWVDTLYMVKDFQGDSVFDYAINDFYFISLIFLGAFFLVNLILAVQYSKFNESWGDDDKRVAEEEKEKEEEQLLAQAQSARLIMASATAYGSVNDLDTKDSSETSESKSMQKCMEILDKISMANSEIVFKVVSHKVFKGIITILIVINAAIMASEHDGSSKSYDDFLEVANLVFYIIFAAEMVFNIIGYGLKPYLSDGFNIFDASLVLIGTLDVFANVGGSGFLVLRAFRLMRLFKLAKQWKSLQMLIRTILVSLSSMGNLGFLMFLFIFIYALVGMQFFGGKIEDEEGETPRSNFDTFLKSLLTIYQILTGENWNEVMFVVIYSTSAISAIYFVSLVVIGNYIVLNLFLAILLRGFDQSNEEEKQEEKAEAEAEAAAQAEIEEQEAKERARAAVAGTMFAGVLGTAARGEQGPAKEDEETKKRKAFALSFKKAESLDKAANRDAFRKGEFGDQDNDGIEMSPIHKKNSTPIDDQHEVNRSVLSKSPPADHEDDGRRGHSALEDICHDDFYAESSQDNARGGSPSNKRVLWISKLGGENSSDIELQRLESQHREEVSGKFSQRTAGASRGGTEIMSSDTENGNKTSRRINQSKVNFIGYFRNQLSMKQKEEEKREIEESLSKRRTRTPRSEMLVVEGRSCGLFPASMRARQFMKSVIQHPEFDNLIYALIFLSSMSLAISEPDISDYKKNVLNRMHYVLMVLFILEALIKIFVLGFIRGPNTYLKDGWNILDFSIVIISIINVLIEYFSAGADLAFVRGFRALRALRPLRMVSRNEGMKTVVQSVLRSLPQVGNVVVISLFFYFIFGILGVQLFKGSFKSCNDETITRESECKGTFDYEGEQIKRLWKNPPYHFDNVFAAMLTLLEVSTLEMWPDIMYTAVDSVEAGKAPEKDSRPIVALYFVIFIFFTTFFILNLFVGVVIDKFNEIQEEHSGSAFLTDDQRKWVRTQRMLSRVSPAPHPIPPENRHRRLVWDFVQHNFFDYFISGCIIVNTIILATYHDNASDSFLLVYNILNYIFVGIFAAEAALKIIALTWKNYIVQDWNRFDFFIVIFSLVSLIPQVNLLNVTVLRVLRITRLFKLIKTSKGLQNLFRTLVISLASLVNIGALLLLLFFMYSVAGMDLFGKVKHGDFINRYANFESFYHSMLILFRASTGESWNGLMHDCSQEDDGTPMTCNDSDDECGNQAISIVFWISFTLFGSFLLLNIFIAVILDIFQETCDAEQSTNGINTQDLENFVALWGKACPEGSEYLPTSKLPIFLMALDQPLGFRGEKRTRWEVMKMCGLLNIPDHGSKVHFAELLWALAGLLTATDLKDRQCEALDSLYSTLKKKFKAFSRHEEEHFNKLSHPFEPGSNVTASSVVAALVVQKYWNLRKQRMAAKKEGLQNSGSMSLAL